MYCLSRAVEFAVSVDSAQRAQGVFRTVVPVADERVVGSIFLAGAEQGGVAYCPHALISVRFYHHLATFVGQEGVVAAFVVPFLIEHHGNSAQGLTRDSVNHPDVSLPVGCLVVDLMQAGELRKHLSRVACNCGTYYVFANRQRHHILE